MNRSQQHYEEIVIVAGESLLDMSGNRRVTVQKGTVKTYEHCQARTYRSYCLEYCGQNNLSFSKCQFLVNSREVDLDRKVLDPCEIVVLSGGTAKGTSLQQALADCFARGMYSNFTLLFKGESMRVHKAILVARSPKFRAMMQSMMAEERKDSVEIKAECSWEVFRGMLEWMYSGECKIPEQMREVCQLLNLADEYLLDELVTLCEESIIGLLDPSNVVQLLTRDRIRLPERSQARVFPECINILLSQFPTIIALDPDVEQKLVCTPGLVTRILLQTNERGRLSKSNLKQLGKTSAKKVRFNLGTRHSLVPAESHSFLDIEYERSHSATQSDTQSLHSLFNNHDSEDESPPLDNAKESNANE